MTDEDLLAHAIGESATRLRDLIGLSEAEVQAAMARTTLISAPIWDSLYCETYLRGKRVMQHALYDIDRPWEPPMRAEIEKLDGLLVSLYKLVQRAGT